MTKPRIANLFLIAASMFVSMAALSEARNAYAQEPSPQVSDEVARPLGLYKAGDVRGAFNLLHERVKGNPDDADARHYLVARVDR